MKDIFAEQNTGYNLRHGNDSQLPKVHTTAYGIEAISFLGNRLWSTLPNIFKQASTLSIFKTILNVGRATAAIADFANIYTTGYRARDRVVKASDS